MFKPSLDKFAKIERIAVISDSALGFGSPDIIGLADGLCAHFGAKGILVQPDDLNRPLVDIQFTADVRSIRLFSDLPTYTRSWRWNFFRLAARAVDDFKPDLVVVVGPNGYGASRALRFRPKLLVYYMLEMATTEPLYADLHKHYGNGDVDAYIIPDIERHNIDFGNLNWRKDIDFEGIYLTAPINYPVPIKPRPADDRNGKMIYFGHIHPEETLLDNMLTPQLNDCEIEFFGRIGDADRGVIANRIASTPGKAYRGLQTPEDLADTLPQFNFSLVTWKPEGNIARFHLPATKLYHSVLAGVPIIAVPNPLNAYFIQKLGIGLLMDGWSRRSFIDTLQQARAMIGTDAYRAMVDRCRVAAEKEFSWQRQVDRCAALVERSMQRKWRRLYAPKNAQSALANG